LFDLHCIRRRQFVHGVVDADAMNELSRRTMTNAILYIDSYINIAISILTFPPAPFYCLIAFCQFIINDYVMLCYVMLTYIHTGRPTDTLVYLQFGHSSEISFKD